jgi:hypothetical protein
MGRYRKKPVEIDAVQFNPGVNDEEIMLFLDDCPGWHMSEEEHGIIIPTLEGDHLARPQDWIIKGVIGEFYPCKPDVFETIYEPVTET